MVGCAHEAKHGMVRPSALFDGVVGGLFDVSVSGWV
jgi:hypothetical protein